MVATYAAQEFAELLTQALAHHRRAPGDEGPGSVYPVNPWNKVSNGRGAFQRRISEARYLLPNHQEVYAHQSKWFELKEPNGRVDTLFGCIGLLNYLLSGEAVVKQIKAVSNDMRREYSGSKW